MEVLGSTKPKPEMVACVLLMVAVFSRLGVCEQFLFLAISTFSSCVAVSDGMPWILIINWKVRGHQPVKTGSEWVAWSSL